jgi:hypothetical protein
MVPGSRGDSTRNVRTVGQAAFGTLSLIRRAGGDRLAARAGLLNAGDCSSAWTGSVDDLTELRRNAATRSGGLEYRATTAQWHAERSARRPKPGKLAVNAALRTYVEERLAGTVVARSGALVPGPMVYWKGRRHGRRKDRRWAKAWSPEQIARRLPVDFPDNDNMRISHEAIYQALFVQGRGALRRELTACLRTGRPLRIPRARARGRGKAFISPEIMISKRPPAARRATGKRAVQRARRRAMPARRSPTRPAAASPLAFP